MVKDKTKRMVTYTFLIAIAFSLMWFLIIPLFQDSTPEIAMVSGTEYISNEPAQVIIRLSDRDGNPLTDYTCTATILYPDKTYFMLDQSMSSSSEAGNYYRSFTTPSVIGVYEETITCINAGNRTLKVSSSFHVSLALTIVEQIFINQSIQFASLMQEFNSTQVRLNELDTLINQTRNELNVKINETEVKLNNTITGRFIALYEDIANASQAKADIFSSLFGP
jgi:hypothetical protein